MNSFLFAFKILRKSILLVALTLGLHTVVYSQNNATITLQNQFNNFRQKTLQEKIYVHLDRSFLITGETLWFKLYLVDGSFHKPVDLSKVAYLEIIKDNGSLLQAKIDLKEGVGSGALYLPASLPSGNYIVRAYTNWMKNFSPDFYFHRPITIINTFKNSEIESTNLASELDVQFFPEGGNLVAGLKSKVAFKSVNREGSVSCSGVIVNEKNDTITSFKSLKYGMGNFTLTPSDKHSYKALIKDESGGLHSVPFPKIYSDGYVMSLKDSITHLTITVTSTKKTPENLILFTHSRYLTLKTETQFLVNGNTSFSISKNLLPAGITHFTLFNEAITPLCERLYFTQPEKESEITISTDQLEYSARKKILLDILRSYEKDPIKINLSLSVFKLDSLSALEHSDIINYLYLTSELTGYIESPEYYFSKDDGLVKEATDNLLLTQGWRRFSWKTILDSNSSSFKFIPEYRGPIITGTVAELSARPVPDIGTFLSASGKNNRLYFAKSGNDGQVMFEVKNFFGSQKISAQHDNSDTIHTLKINTPFSEKFSIYSAVPLILNASLSKNLLSRSISMQVQDVFYEETLNKYKIMIRDSTAFYGEADEKYLLDEYTRFPVMEEVMREYVKGVWIRKRKDGFHFLVLDNINKTVFNEDPLVLLDGVPVVDINQIMELNPLKIKKIEVMTREYYLGSQSFPGIVSFTSYEGDMAGLQSEGKNMTLIYEGLQLQREFYSPRYENESQRSSRLPDQRTLLQWAPEINLTNGKTSVEFYSSDVPGTYQVILQGITQNGQPISKRYTFKVLSR